jgi:hypothetical protein
MKNGFSSECKYRIFMLLVLTAVSVNFGFAQTNEFTYQGKLSDGAAAANGNYDFQFELHNSLSSTTPLASATLTGVTVANGIFTVKLNFAATLFDGTNRFLKISVKPAASPNPFTPLAPYQPITSAPYAIKSLKAENATNAINADISADSNRLGGITADQYVQTNDARMTDARTPLPNSPNYVQNTTSPQTSSNFNVSGTGTANIFNAAIQFNIGGNRVFSVAGSQNVFAGLNAGASNSTGFGNTFVGNLAGNANTTGFNNSFFGTDAGRSTNGDGNSFFGRSAGFATTTGTNNAFFGRDSGRFNISGNFNAFFGTESGFNNTADGNSFFGYRAGFSNTAGNSNSFFGNSAGQANTVGFANSFFGDNAGQANAGGGANSFFGYQAGFLTTVGDANSFFGVQAGHDNTTGNFNSFFGDVAGRLNTTGDNNSFFGNNAGNRNTTGFANSFFGRSAGFGNTTGVNNSSFGTRAGVSNTTGIENSFFGWQAGQTNTTGSNNTIIGVNADVGSGNLTFATAIGSGSTVNSNNTIALGRTGGQDLVLTYGNVSVFGSLGVGGVVSLTLAAAGSTSLCRNASNQIATCSSSLRYKTNVQTFNGGLEMLRRFRPVTFDWKTDGTRDIGFVAEEVNEIEPLLTTRNSSGEIEGVKYAQITTVLVNSIKEQQTQIEQLQKQIETLKKLVCASNPPAEICKEQQ